MQNIILSVIILSVLSVIMTGIITLVNYWDTKIDRQLEYNKLLYRLDSNAWLMRNANETEQSYWQEQLAKDRFNLLKERKFFYGNNL